MDAATVPAELAHKADHRNMWLTSTGRRDASSVVFGFRIPDAVQPRIAEYVELQRQATHAFAHLQLGVPLGSRAMLSTAELLLDEDAVVDTDDRTDDSTDDRTTVSTADRADADGITGGDVHEQGLLPRAGLVAVRANIDGRAARGVADIDVGIRFFPARAAPGNGLDGDALADGFLASRIGAGRITGKYLPQRLYDRIRGSAALGGTVGGRPITEPLVGRVVEELAVDVANPILTDHESDHISGMVVVCAAERLARQHFPERRLRGIATRFLTFIEKSEPAHVVLQELDGRLLVTVVQRGAPCAHVDGVLDDGVLDDGEHGDREHGEDAG